MECPRCNNELSHLYGDEYECAECLFRVNLSELYGINLLDFPDDPQDQYYQDLAE